MKFRDQASKAWVAGLLEGEGSFTHKGSGTLRNISVLCHMTDVDVLQKLKRLTGIGTLHGPYRNGPPKKRWKPRFMWQVSGSLAKDLMTQILPLMCERRSKRIKELLSGFHSVKPKKYELLNVETGERVTVHDLTKWRVKNRISNPSLHRTLTGERSHTKGWRRLL